MFRLVAQKMGKSEAVAEIDTVRARMRRAARALDEVLAALSRANGRDVAPSADTIEFVSEASTANCSISLLVGASTISASTTANSRSRESAMIAAGCWAAPTESRLRCFRAINAQ